MKKIIIALISVVSIWSCQDQQKIAFVNNGDVINDYQMKIDIEKKYEKKNNDFSKRRDSIARIYQAEIQAAQLRLSNMSPQKQQEESQLFSQKWQPIQQQIQFEQQQMEQMFNQEIDSVISKVNAFVEDYGKTNGYTFILGKNQAGSVMYGEEKNDISKELTKALNDAYNTKTSSKEEAKTKETSSQE